MSNTGPALQLSPGPTIAKSTDSIASSSSTNRRNSSWLTTKVVISKQVRALKRIAVIG
jgi:hypothetical protein